MSKIVWIQVWYNVQLTHVCLNWNLQYIVYILNILSVKTFEGWYWGYLTSEGKTNIYSKEFKNERRDGEMLQQSQLTHTWLAYCAIVSKRKSQTEEMVEIMYILKQGKG